MKRGQLTAVEESFDDPMPSFGSVLCGVDGAAAEGEAVRQAALLAGRGGNLELVAVTREWGYGAEASIDARRARQALREARAVAREHGVDPVLRTVDAGSRTEALLTEAADRDLLVVGADGANRAHGIFLGATAPTLVHRSPCPVLVARRPPDGACFPSAILLADDGSESARGAVRIARELAFYRGATIELISPAEIGARAEALAQDAATLYRASGAEPVRVRERGRAADAIVAAAEHLGVSLVVIGSRGLRGLPALASVSERVASRAPYSVLVARNAG